MDNEIDKMGDESKSNELLCYELIEGRCMDITNKIVKICRRIEELEYRLACKDCYMNEAGDMRHELATLELELEKLQPAT